MSTYRINIPEDRDRKYRRFLYPAGETQVRLLPAETSLLSESDRVIVTARLSFGGGDIMELALLTDAIRKVCEGRAEEILVSPYLPYARADRRFVDGDCFGLKVFGDMIDSLCYPLVVTLDAHSLISGRKISNLLNVSPLPLIEQAWKTLHPPVNALLPDEGSNRYGLWGSVNKCEKVRDAGTGALSGFKVPSRESFCGAKSVLIVDDICDGGGTFLGIAKEMEDYGVDMYLYVTHGIFSKGLQPLFSRFKKVFTTDSFRPEYPPQEGLEVLSTRELIDAAIEKLYPST